jgi:hypothetical protein
MQSVNTPTFQNETRKKNTLKTCNTCNTTDMLTLVPLASALASTESPSHPALGAIDRNTSSNWQSGTNQPGEWLVIQLADDFVKVGRVEVLWRTQDSMAKDYQVFSSANGVDWSYQQSFATSACPGQREDTVSGWSKPTKYTAPTRTRTRTHTRTHTYLLKPKNIRRTFHGPSYSLTVSPPLTHSGT